MYQLQKCSCSRSLKQCSLTLFTTEDESSSKTAVSLDTSLVAIASFGHCHLEYFFQDVDVFDRVSNYVGVSAHPDKILSQDFCDTFTVFVTILVGDQSRLKLQQMYGKLFNFQTLYLHYYTTEFDKNHVF